MKHVISFLAAILLGFGTVGAQSASDENESSVKMEPYEFFFRYLPAIASQVTTAEEAEAVFGDPEFLTTTLPLRHGALTAFTPSDIKAEKVTLSDSTEIYVWQFPEPKEMTHCLYEAFVPADGAYRVVTCESSIGTWMVGSMRLTDGFSHVNFGEIKRPESAEQFAEIVSKVKDKL